MTEFVYNHEPRATSHEPRATSHIDCVIVTYNRKDLLLECLSAVYSQTYPINKVILINNASTDGTERALKDAGYFERENFDYHLMQKNFGCSGGLYEGIKISRENNNCEWVWVMDDDTIPYSDALEMLVNASNTAGDKASFFASTKYDVDGDFMSYSGIDDRLTKNGFHDWYEHLADGLVKIRDATFVSILINMKAIQKCGLPCRYYFIWGDDSEYTLRFTENYGPAYLVGKSRVCHKRIGIKGLSIEAETNIERLKNYHYFYRNNLINMIMHNGKKPAFRRTVRHFISAVKILRRPLGFMKCRIIMSGTISAWFQWRKFDSFIKSQLKK